MLLLNGIRLMPEYTPARALLWGSVLALWGSGAVFMMGAKTLNIHTVRLALQRLSVHTVRSPLQLLPGHQRRRSSCLPSVLSSLHTSSGLCRLTPLLSAAQLCQHFGYASCCLLPRKTRLHLVNAQCTATAA